MSDQDLISRAYLISIRPPADAADGYHVSYVPRGLQRTADLALLHALGNGGPPRMVGPCEAMGDATPRAADVSERPARRG